MTVPALDLKTVHQPAEASVEALAAMVRTLNDNQRRLMESWREMRKQLEAVQLILENARITGGI